MLTPAALRITVEFEEHEARMLAAVCAAIEPSTLSDDQRETLHGVCRQFIEAGEAKKRALIDEHGMDSVLDLAERAINAHPTVDEIA